MGFWDVVGILYKHVRFYQFHWISLLFDHHEMACRRKDPPRRVDMNEVSSSSFHKKIGWVIDKTVWTLTLLEPFENRMCPLVSKYIWDFSFGHYFWCYWALFGAIRCYLFERYWELFRLFRQNVLPRKGFHGIYRKIDLYMFCAFSDIIVYTGATF